ncbi:hypothetical protein JZU48_00255, partial [bacterium]|nr:hypothetical protein [bacterium]
MTRDRLHVEVAGLTDALRAVAAARTLGVSITLLSPPAAAAYGGCAWFRRLAERVRRPDDDVDWVLDCGERAGDALTAIADGCPAVVFSGTTAALARLEDA